MSEVLLPDGFVAGSYDWTVSGAATYNAAVDEGTATPDDDTTHIRLAAGPYAFNAVLELTLSNPVGTPDLGVDWVLKVVARHEGFGDNILFDLWQGATQIGTTSTQAVPNNTYGLLTHTITAAQLASITDANDLRIKLTTGGTNPIRVTATDLTIENAAARVSTLMLLGVG